MVEQQIDSLGNPIERNPEIIGNSIELNNLEEEDQPQIKRIGRMETLFNLVNAMIGAGIVSVPSTFKATGVGPTIILLLLSSFLCYYSGVIMLGLQNDIKYSSLNELAKKLFGNFGQNLMTIFIVIYAFSCTIAYLIIGSNQLVSYLSLFGIKITNKTSWAITVLIYQVLLPGLMTIPRSLKCLTKFAIPSVLGVILYLIVMIVKGFQLLPKEGYPSPTAVGSKIDFSIFTSFGVHALTFSLPVIMLPIFSSYNPNVKKRVFILGITFIGSWFIVSIPAVIGYLLYGQNTNSDILSSFPNNDFMMMIVRLGMFISVSVSYPAVTMSITGSLGQVFFNQNIPELFTNKQRLILLPIVNLANYIIAVFFPDIKSILGIGGAIGGCLAGFAFPSLCRIVTRTTSLFTLTNIGHLLFIIFGVVMSFLSTWSSIKDAIASL